MAKRIGQQLGNYRLVSLLGEGGFAEVYLGEHMYLETQAAIKVLHTRLVSEGIEQFRSEARTIARLEHPHIVHVLDFGVEDGIPFLVMSYAPNGTLRQRHPKGTQVPLSSVVSYVKQAASALQYAHEQRVIHRDVKPENLLVDRNHEILLSDFSIALVTQTSLSQHRQDLAGTVAYMAPEQIEGHPRPSSDQYSLAILAYEWLSGERPFQGSFTQIAVQHSQVPPPPLQEKVPGLPAAVEQVVFTALAKDPKQRFATIYTFATALEQVSQISGQASLSALPPFVSPSPVDLTPRSQPARLMTPPNPSIPKPEVTSSSTPSSESFALITPAEQSVQNQLPTERSRRGLSRRAVLLGLAGLVGVGAAGSGLAWLLRSQAPQVSSTLNPKPSPSPKSTSSSGLAQSINSSGAMFGFDPQHTHFNPVEQTLSVTNVSHLVPYWTALTGGPITSSPAVANGVVYVGSDDRNLYAFNAVTGGKLWSTPTGGSIISSPAVANGVVYVGSRDGNLYAFRASTGKELWSFPTGDLVDSSPTVVNGVVYFGSNNSNDYNLYAIDATRGTKRWPHHADYPINTAPALANGFIYVSSPNAKLYAFYAATGDDFWSAPVDDLINFSSPTVAKGVVYVGSRDGNLYAFDARTGSRLWKVPTTGPINSSPAVANGIVYIGSDDGNLYAFDVVMGRQRWKASTGNQIRSSPAVANGVVYIGSDDHKLYTFNAVTGGKLWSAPTGGPITSSPAVINGIVYVGSRDGNLYAFHLP